MNKIQEVYRMNYLYGEWSYVGTLRNERKFELHENVFFAINNNEIAKGKIVGVEYLPAENPEYLYKIQLPEDLVYKEAYRSKSVRNTVEWNAQENLDTISLQCDRIFKSIKQAKESAIKEIECKTSLQVREMENYFKQFEEK